MHRIMVSDPSTTYLRNLVQLLQIQQERIRELEQQNRAAQLLNRLSESMQACVIFEEAYDAIASLLPLLFPDYAGRVFIDIGTQNVAHAIVEWGEYLPPEPTNIYLAHCQILNQTSSQTLISEVSHEQDLGSGIGDASKCCQKSASSEAYQLFCFPLQDQENGIQGLLHLYTDTQSLFSSTQAQLVEKVVAQITLGFKHLKRLHILKLQSIRDPLTGLFNRRYFEEILERLLNRGAKGDYIVSLIMLDIDHFKRMNDTYGHLAGDTVLQDFGIFLKGSVRPTDIVCRYGGEEFAIILPTCPLEIAVQRAEKLRRGIQYLVMEHQGQNLGKVTISAGIAAFPHHASNRDKLIEAADAALYRAKKEGRDRVCVANS